MASGGAGSSGGKNEETEAPRHNLQLDENEVRRNDEIEIEFHYYK